MEVQRRERIILTAQLEQHGVIPAVIGGVHPDPVLRALVLTKTDQPGTVIDRVLKQQIPIILNQEGADAVLVSPIV